MIVEQVYRSIQTIKEMLLDRGYTFNSLDKFQLGELNAIIDKHMIFSIPIEEINFNVIFMLTNEQRVAKLKKILDEKNTDMNVIIVSKDIINETEKKKLIKLEFNIELFNLTELQYNVSKHDLVPKHELLKEDEIETLIASLQLKSKNQLPHILKTDPMARYLGAKSGNIIKITRISPTSGIYFVFRICI